ncbi:MAG: LysR substrate-binding domain-containing protein [Cyanobacteria bacterium P01_D01_bin.123]
MLREGFDTLAALANLKQEQSITELTVTLINDFAFKWLIPRLPKFQAVHPDIDIRLRMSVVVVDLNTRTVDMAIQYG